MANKVSAVFAELPIATTDPVERLDIISSQMSAAKETNQAQAVQWFTNLANFVPQAVSGAGIRLLSKAAQRNVNAITTNIPGPQFPLYAAGRRVLRTYPYVPIGMQVRVGVAILSYDGEVNFGITGDHDHVPDVRVMAEGISAGMDELLVAANRRSSSAYSRSGTDSRTAPANASRNGGTPITRVPEITVRRLTPLPTGRIRPDFASGDLVMSHAIAVLSAMFPNGEDFFVRSVRNYRDQVGDPELRKQVTQFAGQESMHGRLHRDLNRRLSELGFKANLVDHGVNFLFNRAGAAVLPHSVQLAVTAALEHYTATLAEVLLSNPVAQRVVDDSDVRHLLLWHALEETEHKAVAFDVYQTVSGNNRLRCAAMDVITGVFLGGLLLGTLYSTALDPSARDLNRLAQSLARLPSSPFLSMAVVRRIREYNRSDFHPDDFDASALLDRWRTELFAADGLLTDRVRVQSTTRA
jgi:predicted metal-dependent hydrolase